MVYAPKPFIESVSADNILRYAQREFEAISREQMETLALELREVHVEPPKPRTGMIVFADGTDWDPGSGRGAYVYDEGTWEILTEPPAAPTGGTREVLTADRTYFVRTDGSDSATGLNNTTGPTGAFLTLQHAADVVWNTIDLAGFNCIIKLATGTYTGGVSKFGNAVGGIPTIRGDTTTPSNVVITATSPAAGTMDFRRGARCYIEGLKVTATTSGRGLHVSGPSFVFITGNMDWGACPDGQIDVAHLGSIGCSATSYTISGSAAFHISAGSGGHYSGTGAITLSGTPAFSDAFLVANHNGTLQFIHTIASGSATGLQYAIENGGVLWNQSGVTLPGSGFSQKGSAVYRFASQPDRLNSYEVLAQSTTNSSVTGTLTETTLATITIPANTMGPSGRIRITTTWSYTESANLKTLMLKFSGTGGSTYMAAALTTTESFRYVTEICNKGSVSSQEGISVPSAQGGWGSSTLAMITGTANTAADTTVVLSGQLANTGETITLRSYMVETIYGP